MMLLLSAIWVVLYLLSLLSVVNVTAWALGAPLSVDGLVASVAFVAVISYIALCVWRTRASRE